MRRRRFGLKARIAASLGVVLVLTFMALGWWRGTAQVQAAAKDLREEAAGDAALLAAALAPLVVGYDYSTIQIIAADIARREHVVRITVVNARGSVMADSHGPATGRDAGGRPTFRTAAPVRFRNETVGSVTLEVGLERLEAARRRAWLEAATTGGLSIAILWLVLQWLLAWRVLGPVARLQRLMGEIADNPESLPARRVEFDAGDEIGELGRLFDDMKGRLADAQQRLSQRVVAADDALREANAELALRAADLEDAMEKLEALAVTDPLTGVLNRRGFDGELKRCYDHAVRLDRPLSLVLVDLDHFKAINDRFGHPGGDLVLQHVARLLRENVRQIDCVGRLGGDEFALLLADADADAAVAQVGRVMERMAGMALDLGGTAVRLTLSLGVATRGAEVPSLERLLGNADLALYEAKRRGRAGWVAYHEGSAAGYPGQRVSSG